MSFGINDDWSFEEQFLNVNNCPLYGYDNSVNDEMLKAQGIYESHRQFFIDTKQHITKNIGKRNSHKEITFDQVMKDKGNNIFLKCDIEGSEYDILDNIIIHTKQFSGIVIEFHDIHDFNKLNEMINFVGKLDQKLIHTHINNHFFFYDIDKEFYIPSVIELSFTSSQNIELKENIQFPNDLDMPNCSDGEEFKIVF